MENIGIPKRKIGIKLNVDQNLASWIEKKSVKAGLSPGVWIRFILNGMKNDESDKL